MPRFRLSLARASGAVDFTKSSTTKSGGLGPPLLFFAAYASFHPSLNHSKSKGLPQILRPDARRQPRRVEDEIGPVGANDETGQRRSREFSLKPKLNQPKITKR